jgi:hypothetical protein
MKVRETASLLEEYMLEYSEEEAPDVGEIAVNALRSVRDTAERVEDYLLDYSDTDIQLTPAELTELELEMHEGPEPRDPNKPYGLHGWSDDHEVRFEHFSSLELNTKKYPWQRINVNTIPASPLVYVFPRKILVPLMRKHFVKTIGDRAVNALRAYEETPADPEKPIEEGGLSVSQKIGEIAASGESAIVLVSHAESLDDVAVNQGPVAISVASRLSRLIRKVGTGFSKTLTRESYKGKPVPRHFKFFGKIYLTFPDTDNTVKWKIPEAAKKIVIASGARAMYRDIEKGAVIVMAPTGGGMQHNPQPVEGKPAYGPETLHMSDFSENSSRLIGKFGYYIMSAAWGDNVSISSVYKLPDWKKLAKDRGRIISKQERASEMQRHIEFIRLDLAQRTANIAEMPVTIDVVDNATGKAIKRTSLPVSREAQIDAIV